MLSLGILQAAGGVGDLPKADGHEQMLAFAMRTLGAAYAVSRATPQHSPTVPMLSQSCRAQQGLPPSH